MFKECYKQEQEGKKIQRFRDIITISSDKLS
jgi:hypothetical protein